MPLVRRLSSCSTGGCVIGFLMLAHVRARLSLFQHMLFYSTARLCMFSSNCIRDRSLKNHSNIWLKQCTYLVLYSGPYELHFLANRSHTHIHPNQRNGRYEPFMCTRVAAEPTTQAGWYSDGTFNAFNVPLPGTARFSVDFMMRSTET